MKINRAFRFCLIRSNVTLCSPTNILAANAINISQGVVVTINSAQQADVFTNNPNYFGFGGTGTPASTATVICCAAARRPGSRSMIRSTINR